MSVRIQDQTTRPIQLHRGVRQGDVISPKLFAAASEDVFKLLGWDRLGININGEYITQLLFVDDVVIMAQNQSYRHSSASCKAEVEIGGAHSSENRWTLGWTLVGPRCWDGNPAQVNAVLTDDIKRVAGSRWKQAAQDRGFWNSLQKIYVQQWASIG
ncbi:jg21878 [Pararge aegeria aegeria]|uniref:Jg21878 protein n=1 Tax=Pararge aegeria aegeria TaxID=348720 RepID=A0A8S4RV67_9NEOP|nr:jg21878 [Pararge aegeria aegeria]